MNTNLSLNQSLKQQLVLSPQLIQTLEVLAMNNLELQDRIRGEIEQNPALIIPPERNISIERLASFTTRGTVADDYSDTSSYGSDRSMGIRTSGTFDQAASDNNRMFLEGALTSPESLQDHLLEQLGCIPLPEEIYELGRLIISNLDHNGFHKNPVEELTGASRKRELYEALTVVQSLDPSGIAVADVRESLILQARHDGLTGTDLALFSSLVRDHLERLKQGKYRAIAKALDTDEQKVSMLYDYLKTLDPYPASGFDSADIQYIVPELSVKRKDNSLRLHMNTANLPELIIDEDFSSLADEAGPDQKKETNSYIRDALRRASQLQSSVKMRYETIRKIGIILLEKQHEFFLHGPSRLKPLTYRDIAGDVGVHETTISRAVNGKYIDTDFGIFPMKELFSSSLQSSASQTGEVSKRAVKEMIDDIIRENATGKALSDQKIANILQEKGISIARRTVNKYRKELRIDSSYER